MESLNGRVVCITGASSGIGAACAEAFAREGCRLVLSARRTDRLHAFATSLRERFGVAIHDATLDVRDAKAVQVFFERLPEDFRDIAILVNNAGLSRELQKIQEGNETDWNEMIDTNIKGLLYVSRAVLPGMIRRNHGHVINIGSIAGHAVYPGGNVYCASKWGVKALTEGMKMDVLGTPVRVTSVDPGLVETEFSIVRFHGDRDRAAKVYAGMTPLCAGDIAEIVVFCATRPPHVNILETVVLPTAQASVSLVHRT